MNFKKIITLLLAFTLTLSLAACGSKGDGKGEAMRRARPPRRSTPRSRNSPTRKTPSWKRTLSCGRSSSPP